MQLRKPQLRLDSLVHPSRQALTVVLLLLVGGLMVLPLVNLFNDIVTQAALSLKAYRIVSNYIVPLEVTWVVVLLRFLGVTAAASGEYVMVGEAGRQTMVEIIWNCVGWQSVLMFVITVIVGLRGGFSFFSKLKTLSLGLVGTVMVNIIRITLVILLFQKLDQRLAMVFHDYGALLTNTGWLLLFWWFSYAYILEDAV